MNTTSGGYETFVPYSREFKGLFEPIKKMIFSKFHSGPTPELFGPQIDIQRPKKPPNSEIHSRFSIFSFFRNFGSHIRSKILSFVLLTINLQLATSKTHYYRVYKNPPFYESLKFFELPYWICHFEFRNFDFKFLFSDPKTSKYQIS